MHSFLYLGDQEELQGCKALVQIFGEHFVKVQFNECPKLPALTHNWHEFMAKDFFGRYRIIPAYAREAYRVVDTKDGQESMIVSLDTAYDIVWRCLKGWSIEAAIHRSQRGDQEEE